MADLYIALLHYPVLNRNGAVVTTSVANMDVHDIARAARVYGVKRFYMVTPVEAQRTLVRKILDHWQSGYGASYNPSRKEAFDAASVVETLDDAIQEITGLSGATVYLVATGADLQGELVSFPSLRKRVGESVDSWLLLFGTGWGLAGEVLQRADLLLEPLRGATDYNHLSVRSAVSIVLDRLVGR